MSYDKFLSGSPILIGDNRTPGLEIPADLKKLIPAIFHEVKDYGCDFFPTIIQMLTYDEISEIAAYGGFPVRYPHWQFGMEYEGLQKGYEYGQHRIYEMVINSSPSIIYCLDSNTILDNVTVVAHALGHNDFFKNNIFFAPTAKDMVNQMANHGSRIRKYMERWGKERVLEFIDHVLKIETLIDPAKAWNKKKVKDIVIKDERRYYTPGRLPIQEGHEYMDRHINTDKFKELESKKAQDKEIADELGLFGDATKDIMGFIRDQAPLKTWQSDIIAMLYDESIYFAPQRTTKMLNEGWASFIDYKIMCERGLCGLGQATADGGIIEYAKHKMGVLGGKYSMNPYKVGYCFFREIEERWNKGRFGPEYDNCTDIKEREKWDKNVGLGKEKVFDVRANYNDLTTVLEFFDADFCNKYEFFEWKKYPNGEYRIEDKNPKSIKKKLVQKHMNGGLPEIKLVDNNHDGKGILFLQHTWTGQTLYEPYVTSTMKSLCHLWGNQVYLATKDEDDTEVVYCCTASDDKSEIMKISRKDFEIGKRK